jgi:transcriptional antiterminator RfaH
MNSINAMNSINPTNPMNPMNPMNPSNPTNPINPINTQWFVIHTKPSNENRVETNLSNQEIEVFLPLLETFQYTNGKMVPKIKPLFPNYLFAKLDIDVHYYKVKWTRGVSKILGVGSGPIPISKKVIQTIQERMGENNLVKLEDGLERGHLIQFTSGPFKDLMGVFDKRMSDGKRVRVLLGLIGVDVPVQVSRYQIKKVA